MSDFTGKVILVTGGSRGLGKAMSLGFAEQGAIVIIVSRKQDSCTTLAEQIVQAGGQAVGIAANTGKIDDIDALVSQLKADYGRIDLLINNAGTNIALGPLIDLSSEQFDKMFQVNLRGPWYLASRIAPIMAATGGGSIINILSVAALRPPSYNGFYAATKSGLEAITKVMAQEWANDNIRVNAIAPGPYRSDLVDSSIAAIPGFEEGMRDSTLLKRIAETDEILKPVFYLASDGNITGTTLIADGGLTAS
ncbi:MAG: short-chain dehydrogenase [Cellvibrionales bacterium]|nr:short-chain dehydrogenase [Cellvibrionales bacterium]|tara:strand:+ start:2846 stop:3598 length:753 start_codon:yes stop_codon:yes gene_type:complete